MTPHGSHLNRRASGKGKTPFALFVRAIIRSQIGQIEIRESVFTDQASSKNKTAIDESNYALAGAGRKLIANTPLMQESVVNAAIDGVKPRLRRAAAGRGASSFDSNWCRVPGSV